MNRFWGHTLSAAVVAATAGSATPGCAHNNASMFVHSVLAPPTPSAGSCTYNNDPTSPVLSSGTVDGLVTDYYNPAFLIGSTLIPQGNQATPDSETARIEVQGAIVQVVDPATNATIEDATVLTSAIIEPASGSVPSYAGAFLNIMDAAAIAHFTPSAPLAPSKIALVYVTFFGQTLGGQDLQSDQYQFPVDVCAGCLVTYPAGEDPPTYCVGASTSAVFEACQSGMDQTTDCTYCSGTSTYCKNPVRP
jgi:hypothetical protein